MHQLLEKLLKKRKIEDITALEPEEKEVFDKWNRILSEGEMTVDKIREFCESQLNVIKEQMKNTDNVPQKNERLIICLNIYDSLINLIRSPGAERESLEKYLNQLLNQ